MSLDGQAENPVSTADLTPETTAPAWPERHSILVGLGTLLVLHALLILGPLQGVTFMKGAAEPFFIGLVQLWYVLPVGVVLLLIGWRRTARVFAFGALVTFLLNLAACGAFVFIFSQAKW